MTGKIKSANLDSIARACELLTEGGLVAFPTETVYGLGANANDGEAVARIFAAKRRPEFNPLIVHVASMKEAKSIVEIGSIAEKIAAQFWPGPLTMILPRKEICSVSELCSAGLPTLAIRIPQHSVAQQVLKKAGIPIAAPSANRSGQLSPTTPQHVVDSLGSEVDMIIAAGPCEVGLESTVLDLSSESPAILRPGAITANQITELLDMEVKYDLEPKDKPKSPGQLLRHYAPSIPIRLNAIDIEPGEALLAFGSDKFMGIKGGGAAAQLPEAARRNLSEDGDLNEAASNLFKMLHDLDRTGHKGIAVMNIPDNGLGVAINDRLKRAARSVKN